MQRQLYTMAQIQASPEASLLMGHIMVHIRRDMERFADSDEAQLQAIVADMNATDADVAERFAYCELFGGLAHLQLSVLEGDEPWYLLPPAGAARPIDRLALRINGLVCCVAPDDALQAWRAAPIRHLVMARALGEPGEERKVCASCGTESTTLRICSRCKLVRYCGPACQRSHWRVGHRPLCKWARSCIEGNFA